VNSKFLLSLGAASLLLTTAIADEESLTRNLLKMACVEPYRKLNGQVYDLTPRFFDASEIFAQKQLKTFAETPVGDFDFVFGKVLSVVKSGILVREFKSYYGYVKDREAQIIFIKNFPFSVIDDQTVAVYAAESGTYSYTSALGAIKTVRQYDFGKIPNAAEIEEAKVKAKERAQNYQNAMAAQKALADAAQAKKDEQGKAAAIKFLKEKAAEGAPMSQYRLAEKYLKGDGVPIDMQQAKFWLQCSCTNGYADASNLLHKIQIESLTSKP